MSRRLRTLLFVILAVFLVIGVDRIAVHRDTDHRQSQAKIDARKAALTKRTVARDKPKHSTRLIPLYSEGDLQVRKAPKPKRKNRAANKKKPEKKKPKTAKEAKQLPVKKVSAPASQKLDGDRPVLEVSYEDIGFDRYLDVIERVGRLFVLVKTAKGLDLGPEISLRRGHLYPGRSDMSNLAIKRPHQVSDAQIRNRLAGINTPVNAVMDSIVLILNKPFDALLWDTITDSLKSHGLQLHQVGQITGTYSEGRGRISLRLEIAIIKGSNKLVYLDKNLMVALMR